MVHHLLIHIYFYFHKNTNFCPKTFSVEKCNNFWWKYIDFDLIFNWWCWGVLWILEVYFLFLFSVNTEIIRDWNLSLSNVATFLYLGTCLCFYHIHNRLKSLKKCIIGKANFCLHQRLISTFFEISSNGVFFKPRMYEKHFKQNVAPTGIQAYLWVDDVLNKSLIFI